MEVSQKKIQKNTRSVKINQNIDYIGRIGPNGHIGSIEIFESIETETIENIEIVVRMSVLLENIPY